MTSQQRLRRDFYLRKLRKILSRCDKASMLVTMWLLDRSWSDPQFDYLMQPSGYNFPSELFSSDISNRHCVYGWEVETLTTELLGCPPSPGRRTTNAKSWDVVARMVNHLRHIEDAEFAVEPTNHPIERQMTRLMFRQLKWQSNVRRSEYIRWWSMFREAKLAAAFERIVGVNVKDFVMLGVAWNASFNSSPILDSPNHPKMANVLAALSSPLVDLEQKSVALVAETKSIAYRRGVLRQTPVVSVQLRDGLKFMRPMEALLQWRISSGLYYDVIGDKEVRDGNYIGLNDQPPSSGPGGMLV